MKYTFTLLLLFSASLITTAQESNTPADERLLGIDSLLNKVLKDQQLAGFSVAVVDGNQVIYSKGFGYRDLAQKKPVSPNTLFAIGSSTKTFTAALSGILEKEGKLSLDGNAVSYLPQLRFFNDQMNNQITIRDLMTHRTGVPRYDLAWYLFNTSNRDSMMNRLRYLEPNAGLREKWQYNNFMYLAQGMITEKLSGKTWEQQIKERFFLPLEMTRSNTSMEEFKKDADAALPYQRIGENIKKMDYYDLDGMAPAGGINSTANDMANWIKLWTSGGAYKGKEVLPKKYTVEATSSQMVISGGLPGNIPDVFMEHYGLGWFIAAYRGHYQVEHGGNIDGFSASVSVFPTDQVGIVVLTNQDNSAVPQIVINSIADRLFKLKPIDWNGKVLEGKRIAKEKKDYTKEVAALKQIPNTKPSHPLTAYTGTFDNPGYGQIEISVKKDSLFAQIGKYRGWLKQEHYDTFQWRNIPKGKNPDTAESNIKFNFSTNNEGKIESFSSLSEEDVKPAVFTLKSRLIDLDPKTLEQYTGDYLLGTTAIQVSIREKSLFVNVSGQPEYETVPMDNHSFKLKRLNGYSVIFDTKDHKKAKAVFFIQPNGIFKAIRKSR